MLTIRPATVADAALIRQFIWELADFEKAPDEVHTTEAQIARDGFGAVPEFRTLIAEWHGQPAGFALFFGYYSTWRGAGFYLEDLFVRPDYRGHGIGTALLSRVAQIAAEEGRCFMKWSVLKWNQPAIDLYKNLGGEFLDEWRDVFLEGDGLRKLADRTAVEKAS